MDEMKQRAVKHVVGLHPNIRENDSHHHHRKKTDDAHVESAKINAHQKQHHPFLFDSAQAVLQKTAVQCFFTDGRCQRNDKQLAEIGKARHTAVHGFREACVFLRENPFHQKEKGKHTAVRHIPHQNGSEDSGSIRLF